MPRKKLKKINEVLNLNNVFSESDEDIRKQLKLFFGNSNLFTLEIGCGRGDYSIELAKLYPERNFVGIDYKGARIYSGAAIASEMNLKNVAFVVTGAEKLEAVFKSESVEEIFLPFPDPHKFKNRMKRLISEEFLSIYKNVVQKNAKLHLKTDNQDFYDYAMKVLKKNNHTIIFSTTDLYAEDNLEPYHLVRTKYENKFLSEGKKINYISFGF